MNSKTKKFIHTSRSINGATAREEFIIPDLFEGTRKFIGLDSGTMYDAGEIVFTGVDLDANEILSRINSKKIGLFRKGKFKRQINRYLDQIKVLKINDTVRLNEQNDLEKVDLKNRYFRRKWEKDRIEAGESWGKSTWFIETDYLGFPLRKIEIYENRRVLKYSAKKKKDKFGQLGERPLDLTEFEAFKIHSIKFGMEWKKHK